MLKCYNVAWTLWSGWYYFTLALFLINKVPRYAKKVCFYLVCVSQEAMRHEMCDRLYVTQLDAEFPADVYHPHIDHSLFTPTV